MELNKCYCYTPLGCYLYTHKIETGKDIIFERHGKYYGNDNDTKDSGRCSRT